MTDGAKTTTRPRWRTTIFVGVAMLLVGAGAAAFVSPTASDTAHDMTTWALPDTLSPQGRAVAAKLANTHLPPILPPVFLQRKIVDRIQGNMGAALEKRYGVRLETTTIAGVTVRIVYPKGVAALGNGPVLMNLHGGGFQLDSGSLTESIPIAALSGVPVVSVLYRLAPEYPYPAALDDALAVYSGLLRNRSPSHVAVYGTSAGAILSGEMVAKLIADGRPLPAAIGYFSGSADMGTSGDSESWMPLPGGGKELAEAIHGYIAQTPITDPILSPLHGNLSRFPPTLLVSSTRDALLSETSIFARALFEQGVDSHLVVFDGLPHAFWTYMTIPETDQANVLMATYLKSKIISARG